MHNLSRFFPSYNRHRIAFIAPAPLHFVAMDRPTTPGGSHYGRPPAYDDEDGFSPPMQGGSTMRLLTNVDDSQSYMP